MLLNFVNASCCVPLPRVAGAALLQADISNTFQLRHKKLDGVIHGVCCLGQAVLVPHIVPKFKRGKLAIIRSQKPFINVNKYQIFRYTHSAIFLVQNTSRFFRATILSRIFFSLTGSQASSLASSPLSVEP